MPRGKQHELDSAEATVREELDGVAAELAQREVNLRLRANAPDRSVADGWGFGTPDAGARRADGSRGRVARGEQPRETARAEGRASSETAERSNAEIARLGDQIQTINREIENLDSAEGRASMTVQRLETEQQAARHL